MSWAAEGCPPQPVSSLVLVSVISFGVVWFGGTLLPFLVMQMIPSVAHKSLRELHCTAGQVLFGKISTWIVLICLAV